MAYHHHTGKCEGHICNHVSNVATQSLAELEFQRGLWTAALSGDVKRATNLLQNTDANIRDESGFTPLHYACRAGKIDICKLLVSRGADVNAMIRSGATPLHRASYCGHDDIVSFLLSSGADVRIVDDEGKTALHKAAEQSHESTFKLLNQHLTSKYPDLNINTLIDTKGKSPFDYLPLNLKQSLTAS